MKDRIFDGKSQHCNKQNKKLFAVVLLFFLGFFDLLIPDLLSVLHEKLSLKVILVVFGKTSKSSKSNKFFQLA